MNVILIILDTLRADYLGCYGAEWIRTPNIDRLAQESFVFDETYAEGCPTLQARRALWTGRRTFPFHDHEVLPGDILNIQPGWMPLHHEDVCLSEMLLDEGYMTTYITDVPQVFKPSMNFQRGFVSFDYIRGQSGDHVHTGALLAKDKSASATYAELRQKIGRNNNNVEPSLRDWEADCMAPRVFSQAMRWLEHNHGLDKFFLVVDSFDPHEPYDPPEYYRNLYTREQLMTPSYELVSPNGGEITEDQIAHTRQGHAGEITMTDRWLGQFLESVELMGLKDNTLICFISDHGTMVGDHGMLHKGPDGLFRGVTRVPMMVRHPKGIGAGQRSDALNYNIDLVPTILDFAGVAPHERVTAKSLAPLIRGEASDGRPFVTSGFNSHLYYHDAEWDYSAHRETGPMFLFKWKEDPQERVNVLADNPQVVEMIQQRMEEEVGPTPPFDIEGFPPPKDYVSRYHQVRMN